MGDLFTLQVRLDSNGYREYRNKRGESLIYNEDGKWYVRYSKHSSITECPSEIECLAHLTDSIVLVQAQVEGVSALDNLAISR